MNIDEARAQEIAAIERLMDRLRQWRLWYSGSGVSSLNYPSASIEQSYLEGRQTGSPVPPLEAQLTEQAMCKLPVLYREAVVLRWTQEGQIGDLAKEHGYGKREFSNRLSTAYRMMASDMNLYV